jgi:CHAT domain-containing protein/Tfp pilus assembly protein PilF
MRLPLLFLAFVLCIAPDRALAADEKPSASEIDRQIAHAGELFEQGHTAEARQICESLLRTLPNNPPSEPLAYALNTMSKIYASEGDYEEAIRSAERSADIYEQIEDANGAAHALNNKGIAELQNGTYSTAQQDLEKALVLSRAGNDLESQVQVLNNLGSALYFRGSYSEATHSYDQAMSLVSHSSSAKWADYWLQITKFNQATLLQRLGRYGPALHIYREVEASSRTLTGDDRAHLEANLGTLYRRLGDPYKALDTYRAAQHSYSRQKDADGEIAVLKNIGIAYALDLEDFSHAESIFRAALALAQKTHNRREEMQAHLYLGETLLRSNALPLARSEFARSQAVANELATTEEQWKSLYGLGRIESLSGNPDAAERDYRQAISVIEQTRSQLQFSALRTDFFADKREAYDALVSILLKKSDVSEAFLFLERSRARNFQDRIQDNHDSGRTPLTLAQTQSALAPETAVLEFWTSGDRLGLIWCTHDATGSNLRVLTPDQQTKIQELLRNFPNNLRQIANNQGSPLDVLLPNNWSLPPGIRHLMIVPDAWISYVPFDLLHGAGDSKSLLIEQYDISYLPSAALLRRSASADQHVRWPWTRELVAFGDPVIKDEQTESSVQDADQQGSLRLPYSAKEIEDISQLVRGTSQTFLQRSDLKKPFLSGAANSAPLLHVSTHAFADGDNPENSRMLFSPVTGDGPPDYVSLRELYDLDLSHVQLATISACDTERGKIIRGEGVQAFSRALLSAGAASSLTALWRVGDEPTAEFMKQFYYFALKENKPKAEALRLAKLKFLHSNSNLSDPSVWAAFVLDGDGLAPVPRVLSWTELVLASAGFAVLLLALVLIARLRSRGSRHG